MVCDPFVCCVNLFLSSESSRIIPSILFLQASEWPLLAISPVALQGTQGTQVPHHIFQIGLGYASSPGRWLCEFLGGLHRCVIRSVFELEADGNYNSLFLGSG